MRSEERAGIVFAVLLLLWGTLITEPLHIFLNFFHDGISPVFDHSGIGRDLTLIISLSVIFLILLLISRTGIVYYIPCVVTCILLAVEVIRFASGRTDRVNELIALSVTTAVIGILHLFKSEKLLLWLSDLFIYSIPVSLMNDLIFVPISKQGGIVDKILYITRYDDRDLTSFMNGLMTLPGVVWGSVIFIVIALPGVYYSFYRKKG